MFLFLIPLAQLIGGTILIGSLALGNLLLGSPDQQRAALPLGQTTVVDYYSYKSFHVPFGDPMDRTCTYKVLIISYDRTWPQEVRSAATDEMVVLPPEPGKVVNHAYLLYRKECKDHAPEPMFYMTNGFGAGLAQSDQSVGTFKPIVPSADNQVDPRYATVLPYVPHTLELVHAAADRGDPNAIEALKWTGMFSDKVRAAMIAEAKKKGETSSPTDDAAGRQ
jgi:hypothetical protein